jgi:hypothetical protein
MNNSTFAQIFGRLKKMSENLKNLKNLKEHKESKFSLVLNPLTSQKLA